MAKWRTHFPRPIRIDGEDAYILLTRGLEAVVDARDAHLISDRKWNASPHRRTFYATGTGGLRMHRVIIGAKKGQIVDHIDGDGLNNRRANLRITTAAQNARNCRLRKDNTSGFKGVHFDNQNGWWRAQINIDGKRVALGTFDTAEAAYASYCEASQKHYGEYGGLDRC